MSSKGIAQHRGGGDSGEKLTKLLVKREDRERIHELARENGLRIWKMVREMVKKWEEGMVKDDGFESVVKIGERSWK